MKTFLKMTVMILTLLMMSEQGRAGLGCFSNGNTSSGCEAMCGISQFGVQMNNPSCPASKPNSCQCY